MNTNDKIMTMINDEGTSNYKLSKKSGISQNQLSKLKSGEIKLENMSFANVQNLLECFEGFYLNEKRDNLNFDDLLDFNIELTGSDAKGIAKTIDDITEFIGITYPDDPAALAWSEIQQNWNSGSELLDMVSDDIRSDDDDRIYNDDSILDKVESNGLDTYYSFNNDFEPLDYREFKAIVDEETGFLRQINK